MTREKWKLTELGQEIKIECIRRKITLTEAAEIIGMSHQVYLSKVMYGQVAVGKYKKRIEKFLGKVS